VSITEIQFDNPELEGLGVRRFAPKQELDDTTRKRAGRGAVGASELNGNWNGAHVAELHERTVVPELHGNPVRMPAELQDTQRGHLGLSLKDESRGKKEAGEFWQEAPRNRCLSEKALGKPHLDFYSAKA